MVFPRRYEIADTAGFLRISVSDAIPHCRYEITCVPADTGALFLSQGRDREGVAQSCKTVGTSSRRDILRPPFETGLAHTSQIKNRKKMFANMEK